MDVLANPPVPGVRNLVVPRKGMQDKVQKRSDEMELMLRFSLSLEHLLIALILTYYLDLCSAFDPRTQGTAIMILPTLLLFLSGVAAQEGNSTTTSSNGTTPTDVASAAVPSATVPLDTPVIGQGVLPPPQWWCNNKGNGTYCPGALLQDVELAGIFPDSKVWRSARSY